MAKHPDDVLTTDYEWVVETIDADDDIVDCSYWPEGELDRALADRASTSIPDGGRVDFGLARRTGCEAEGMTDRGYIYFADGEWPAAFDNGKSVPRRFAPILDRIATEIG